MFVTVYDYVLTEWSLRVRFKKVTNKNLNLQSDVIGELA